MTLSASIAEPIRRVGVVGPGLMGLGIAQTVATAGIEVALCGRDVAAAEAGVAKLAASLRRQVLRKRLEAADAAAILALVRPATVSAKSLQGCGLGIESVNEDRALKTSVLAALQAAAPAAILATNTSGLAIAGLGAALADPAKFLGLHFFSPAERMALVEVVTGPRTAPSTTGAALAFLRRLGKRPILVRDGPGFFATRVFAAYLDEAAAMVAEGVSASAIEEAGVANGRALGPLAMFDETGIALNLAQARQARADGLDARFCRPLAEPVLVLLAAAGRRGRRSGGGFFEWREDGTRLPWAGLAAAFPRAPNQPDLETIGLRLRIAEAREALRCLEEGVIVSADDADTATVLGLGFPKRLGGVLRWAEDFGLANFVEACERLAADRGERFVVTPWLREQAARGNLNAFRQREFGA
jgi:3-hydroxyacyl-CoA dehydrogenase/enoyl-CoA hydratase/3-hydroxybutyryl-CoA epimerase